MKISLPSILPAAAAFVSGTWWTACAAKEPVRVVARQSVMTRKRRKLG
ncbi:MAG TPA: hypothetical protein VK956_05775 [Verrucomicrobium sp.]|nr:hypothetical protein [Verrucomicrobium sp.]